MHPVGDAPEFCSSPVFRSNFDELCATLQANRRMSTI